ncbi:hypothetical protein F183_A28790 [Bryobacterales bacterium F-183]|nr:hypothetical protein F183_A28790 [Bryobacterales bacterium F-183]
MLNAATGILAGTPSAQGTFSFTVQATDSRGASAARALSLTVNASESSANPSTTISVTSPGAGSSVAGNLSLTVAVQGPVAYVDYLLNGKSLSGPVGVAPYAYPWHTALAWDGAASLVAVARDSAGNELARSSRIDFLIDNAGTTTVSQALSGASGIVNWSSSASTPGGVEGISFVLDGQFSVVWGTAKALDSKTLANGDHDFFNGIYTRLGSHAPVGMARQVVRIDNGHSVRMLQPRWCTLFLKPAGSAVLSANILYTDNQTSPITSGITYSSSNPAVATVDSSGTVRGVAPGAATITMTWGAFQAQTTAQVSTSLLVPHFSRDGQIMTSYDPARSIFVRSLFGLGSDEVNRVPGLGTKAQEAGVNALTEGFYQNPADNPYPSLADWKAGWQPWWNLKASTAASLNMSLYLTGDDMARTVNELSYSVTNPWAGAAITHAFSTLRDSKRVIAVDMVDEVNFMWGNTPKPADNRWASFSPPVPNNAFTKLMGFVNAAAGRPPVSWPVAGLSGSTDVRNWLGDPTMSDYTSQFWTFLDWRTAYPDSASLPQYRSNMETAILGRLPVLQPGVPSMVLTTAAGPFYTKNTAAPEYQPGPDFLQAPGASPSAVAASILFAAASGQAGVRVYHLDTNLWKTERLAAPLGNRDNQTGADPFQVGTDRWQAIATAFNLVKRLEPHLMQDQLHSPELGSTIVSCARQGAGSRLVMAVNMSEASQPIAADLSPYLYAGAPSILRFRSQEAALWVDRIAGSLTKDDLVLGPGEAVAWLFTPSAEGAAAIRIAQPLNAATVSGVVKLAATSSDAPTKVVFLVDGTVVGTATSAPYTVSWNSANVTRGTSHSVVARAYNAAGAYEESRIRIVTR